MRTWHPSLEPCTWCQVVSMNFGSGYIFFCQHSHAPQPDQPASGREEGERREGGGGIFMPWSGFRHVSLLHDRGHLAAALSTPALLHSRSGMRPRLGNSRTNRDAVNIHHLCLNKIEISELEAKWSQCSKAQSVKHPRSFLETLCDDNCRPVVLEVHMRLLNVDMCIF